MKGVGNPSKKGKDLTSRERGKLKLREAEKHTGIDNQRKSDWKKALIDKPKYRQRLIDAARKKAKLESADNHRAEGTGENEWFTPAKCPVHSQRCNPRRSFLRNIMSGLPSEKRQPPPHTPEMAFRRLSEARRREGRLDES